MLSPDEKAPLGCLSSPMAMPTSASPARIARTVSSSRLPPVAQPLNSLVNGMPVRPRNFTIVSGIITDRLPA